MTESHTDATTSSLHLLTGAYAVDALDDVERARFEAHLHDCADCRREVAELSEAVVGLTHLPPAVSVPESLGSAVRSAIARVRPLPPLVGDAEPGGAASGGAGSGRAGSGGGARSAGGRRHRSRRWAGLMVAASVLAVVGVGTAVWPDADRDSLSVSRAASAVLDASDMRRSTVDFEQGASATIYHSDSVGEAVLVATGMPPAPAGMVYAVWLDQPTTGLAPAGFLTGEADQSVVLTGDAASADGAAITIEPVGGGDNPTGTPMAAFDFGQGA